MLKKNTLLLCIAVTFSVTSNAQKELAMNQPVKKIPRIGVGVLIISGSHILLGKRKNAHGENTWSPPGGHLEFGETPEQCAQRETLEECGLEVANIRLGGVTNDIFTAEEKHYITLMMIADYTGGTPQVLEPHKCDGWEWFDLHDLPTPLFLPLQNLRKSHDFETLTQKKAIQARI